MAIERLEAAARWAMSPDTFPYDSRRGLNAETSKSARSCVARFASADAVHLRPDPLFLLALAAGDDSLASRMLRAAVAAQPVAADSLDLLATAYLAYMRAPPPRPGLANSVASRLDSLGYRGGDGPTDGWLEGRMELLGLGFAALDSSAMAKGSRHVLAAVKALPAEERDGVTAKRAILMAFAGEVLARLRSAGPDSAVALLKARAEAAMGPGALDAAPGMEALALLGQPVPPMRPDFLFGAERIPLKGVTTLVQFVDPRCSACTYPVLRRLKARLGSELELVLVTHTRGMFGGQLTPSPALEAELLRRHFLETLRLQATLAVWVAPLNRRPPPDARVQVGSVEELDRLRVGPGLLIIDRSGRVTLPTLLHPDDVKGEAYLQALLEALSDLPVDQP